jgi:hypothetical protein
VCAAWQSFSPCRASQGFRHRHGMFEVYNPSFTRFNVYNHTCSCRFVSITCIRLCTILLQEALTLLFSLFIRFDSTQTIFVIGYGMDFAERFRSLSCIGVLKPEVHQQKAWETIDRGLTSLLSPFVTEVDCVPLRQTTNTVSEKWIRTFSQFCRPGSLILAEAHVSLKRQGRQRERT